MKLIKNFLLPYLDRRDITLILVALLLNIIGVICSVRVPFIFKEAVDEILKAHNFSKSTLISLLIIIIIQLVVLIISDYLLQYVGIQLVFYIRKKIVYHLNQLNKQFFDVHDSGELTSILTNDSSSMHTLITSTLPKFITSFLSIILLIFSLLVLSYKLTIVIVISLPIILISYGPFGKKLGVLSHSLQEQIGKLNSYGFYIIQNNSFIKSHSSQNFELKKGMNMLNILKDISLKRAKITAAIAPILNIISLLVILSVISYGFFLTSTHEISIGTLAAYVTLFFQIMGPIESFGSSLAEFEGLKGTSTRIQNLLNNQQIENINNGIALSKIYSLEFKNVSFSYNKVNEVLKQVSFKINKGEIIALTGPSGSGKSTIMYLIEQFYSDYSGTIEINGNNIKEYSLQSIRDQIAYIPQQNYIIPESIRNNILYPSENSSDADIFKLSAKTNLSPVLRDFTHGLDTYIGPGGITLSEGQKQRIAITRELLKNKSLFLLDEITSALDSESEHIIQENLSDIVSDKITFIIAHRLSTIKNANKIIFLENGIITGFDSHDNLVKKHKKYAEFVKFQFGRLE